MSEAMEDPDDDRPRTPRGVRRVGVGAVLGSVAALLVSWLLAHGTGPVSQEPQPFSAPPGACLDWTSPDGADVAKVDCQQPHLFEAVGPVSLTTAFGPAAAFPAEEAWPSIVQEKCTPLVATFLEDRYDPLGRFSVGALKPSQPGWRNGDRTLHCGLQVVAQSGELYRTMGAARGQDQSDVHEPGTCLAIDGVDVGDPVDCAQPHAVEVVGTMDFAVPFPAAAEYPDEARQDAAAEPVCTKLADDFAGGPGIVAEKKLTVYWDTLSPESWRAGSRRVDCKLGALLPDKTGFAPVTGSVRGVVAIGTVPAPPTSATATPGAPAPVPPVGPTPGTTPPVEPSVPPSTLAPST